MKEPLFSQCYYHITMSVSAQEILLVTPVWNDSARLAVFGATLAEALADCPLPIRWIIADDGSHEGEYSRLTDLKNNFSRVFPRVEVHFATEHLGKGAAVRAAWALYPDADWFSFLDADGSVTAADFLRLMGLAVSTRQSVLAVRKRTETTEIIESRWRGFAHRGFLVLSRLLLDLKCEDTQCGAKIINGDDYRHVAPRLIENGLAFDSELLFTLKRGGADWLEVPVNWTEKEGGKVKPLRDVWGMLAALIRVSRRVW